jgi:uncharacterized protein YgbK (DUF1537 family)
MVIVIADDFSGAAEIGGIGHRYGLNTEVQLKPAINSSADLIVIDANTRSMSRDDANYKTRELVAALKKAKRPFRLFKKVDSVMRGHIAEETIVIQEGMGYKRVLLLPANPGRGRKIMNGAYYLNGITLDQTVFSADPDFPISSALVEKTIKPHSSKLPYQHIGRGDNLPASSFITGDVETKEDIRHYLSQTGESDLCVGAAECFEGFLENLGYISSESAATVPAFPYTLIVNGSTVKVEGERGLFKKWDIPYSSMPDISEESNWHSSVLQLLQKHPAVVVAIDYPLNRENNQPAIFLDRFVELVHYISIAIGPENIHLGLTGGATASAIIRNIGIEKLEVRSEIVPGVVTLEGEKGLFTVKPGSYPWPESFFSDLQKR